MPTNPSQLSKLVTIAVLPSRRRQQISNGAQLPDVLRVRSSASFRLANLAANIHPRCSRPMDFTKPSPGNAARVFDHHLYMYVMAALSSQQPAPVPSVRRRHVKSRAPIPFSAHPRSIDGGSSPDNLPLATGSGTKAMAEAMRAKKVAICLYMVAIKVKS